MTTAMMTKPYQAETFELQGLQGISQEQLEQHYKLYQGYVNNTNILNDKLQAFVSQSQVGSPEYGELKRRFGFEYSGMRLHEYYFNNMQSNGGKLDPNSKLYKAIEENFGSYEAWEADFKATGMMRGIGWAVLFQDPNPKSGNRLQNFWLSDHENGHPAGFQPILVMDVWEHAYCVDYKPTERKTYVDAFFANINWKAAEARLA
jgi:superoxide dismutase, Fe-Mn family